VFPQCLRYLPESQLPREQIRANAAHYQQVFNRYWIFTRVISVSGAVLTSQECTQMIEERLLRGRIA
jgi:hypothetical protein